MFSCCSPFARIRSRLGLHEVSHALHASRLQFSRDTQVGVQGRLCLKEVTTTGPVQVQPEFEEQIIDVALSWIVFVKT